MGQVNKKKVTVGICDINDGIMTSRVGREDFARLWMLSFGYPWCTVKPI